MRKEKFTKMWNSQHLSPAVVSLPRRLVKSFKVFSHAYMRVEFGKVTFQLAASIYLRPPHSSTCELPTFLKTLYASSNSTKLTSAHCYIIVNWIHCNMYFCCSLTLIAMEYLVTLFMLSTSTQTLSSRISTVTFISFIY